VQPANIDETSQKDESAQALVMRLAIEKAQTILIEQPQALVIGSDTLIVCNERILGKPENKTDFLRMMQMLSNKQHQVLTAVACLTDKERLSQCVSTHVEFAQVSKAEAEAYWLTGEPQDKAGGYAIQGIGAQFVKRINGSYSAVVGLPLYETKQMLEALG
jgi:septum formation protein